MQKYQVVRSITSILTAGDVGAVVGINIASSGLSISPAAMAAEVEDDASTAGVKVPFPSSLPLAAPYDCRHAAGKQHE